MDGVKAWIFYRLHWQRALAITKGTAFSAEEESRLRQYWYGVCYLCSVFDLLRGRRLSRQERDRIAPAAALAAFFDDLSHQKSLIHAATPEDFGRAADSQGWTLKWLQQMYGQAPAHREDALRAAIRTVFEAEKLSEDSLENLTRKSAQKGGWSVLLFRLLLEEAPDENTRQAMLQFGTLIQLCDDILDIWFDIRDGVETPATLLATQGDLPGLITLFETQTTRTRQTFLAANAQRGPLAWVAIHFIVSIARVSLVRYTALSKKNGTLPLENRRLMVTDMAQWPNRLRAARMLFKHL
jgi:hypothetical protein